MTRWSAITRTRRSCSALAYGSRSTAAAEKTSTGSYTTSGDATDAPDGTATDSQRSRQTLRAAFDRTQARRELAAAVRPDDVSGMYADADVNLSVRFLGRRSP